MPAPRFLIDENLSVKLPEVAHEAGYEATHVNHLSLNTRKDWTLLDIIRDADWVFVTNNAVEFRTRYAREALHAGLVLMIPNVRRVQQIELFRAALAEVARDPEFVNTVIEVDFGGGGIATRRYDWPD